MSCWGSAPGTCHGLHVASLPIMTPGSTGSGSHLAHEAQLLARKPGPATDALCALSPLRSLSLHIKVASTGGWCPNKNLESPPPPQILYFLIRGRRCKLKSFLLVGGAQAYPCHYLTCRHYMIWVFILFTATRLYQRMCANLSAILGAQASRAPLGLMRRF